MEKKFGELKALENFTAPVWNADTYRKVPPQYSPKVKACDKCNEMFGANCINNRTNEPAHLCPGVVVTICLSKGRTEFEEKTREAYLFLQKAIDKKDPIPANIVDRKPCNAYTRNVEMTRRLQDIGGYLGCIE